MEILKGKSFFGIPRADAILNVGYQFTRRNIIFHNIKKNWANFTVVLFFNKKKCIFSQKSALVRPLRKYGVTESIAMTAILFSRVLEKNIYIMFGGFK